MRELWLVAKQEYGIRVRQRSFLLGTLAIPLLIVVIVGGGVLISLSGKDERPLGYVDQAGLLAAGAIPPTEAEEETIAVRAFADPVAAQAALEAGEIQAFYVLPADYLQTQQVSLYYLDKGPGSSVQHRFEQLIRASLLAGQPLGERSWALEGPSLAIRSADGTRDWSESSIINAILPFVIGFFFFFMVMSTSGYMLEVVSDEKENRTIEVMVTSMTPEQLIGGKSLGLMAVALIQMSVWVVIAVAALLVAAPFVPFLRNIQVPWTFLVVSLFNFLPSYALVSGMMTAIGGAVTDFRQGQQVAGILNTLFILPALFSAFVFINPDSPVLVILTLFPTTALLTIMLRWGLTIIPLWQLVASWVLLMASAGLSVWAAARIFRMGMLRYGQRLDVREVLAGLRLRKSLPC